ncbi:MAG TPA: molybdenum cofactor biosynthesis protein MoaE [Acidimicrobiales bacterium]|nr:molybdenum cofactor biosynthesis protein MoaE [Acidimicrobiales bacterium]
MSDPNGNDWIALAPDELAVGDAASWVVLPSCGGVVVFAGTVRDHAEGRDGVTGLVYEAYEQPAVERMTEVVAACRGRWPEIGRVACWHRTGAVGLTDVVVVVAVSAPHRATAFDAARYVIDTVKESVPIWKHETWADGTGWGTGAQPIGEVVR